MARFRLLAPLAIAGFVMFGCSDDASSSSSGGGGDPLANATAVAQNYAKNVYQNYSEAYQKALAMDTAINDFVQDPTAAKLEAAKTAWIVARAPYGPSEVYRFYGGPIDSDTGPEGHLNAWPLDENFIDYTRDNPTAGIINDTVDFPNLDEATIRGENENGGEKNIATGYHAIEFLLWGQDNADPTDRLPGSRPYTDYVTNGTGTAANQQRRGLYLRRVSEMVVEDLKAMVTAWEPNKAGNYASTFATDGKDAVTKILTGLGSMANAELSGERMTVAYKNKGQEDEHSCFSDNTNADLLGNAQGMENAYLGTYGTNDGPGIDDLVRVKDPALADQMKTELAEAIAALRGMTIPFDAAIAADDAAPERQQVLKAIQAIKKVAETTVKIGAALGITFQIEEPSETL